MAMYSRVNALRSRRMKKITFEFQTIDSKLTARGAGADGIGRNWTMRQMRSWIFFHTPPCLLKFFTEKWA